MKKKRWVASVFVGLFVLGHAFSVGAMTGETKAVIDFKELGVPDILDPIDPNTKVTPPPKDGDDGFVNGTPGELTLDFAPNLYFGEHVAQESMAKRFKAQAGAKTGTMKIGPFVQVTDRRQDKNGWLLTVQMSPFTSTELSDSLPGAFLTFEGGKVTAPSTSAGKAPTVGNPVKVMNEEQTILNATDAGKGTWLAHWIGGDETSGPGIYLTVADSSMKRGEHVATLTWTLKPQLVVN